MKIEVLNLNKVDDEQTLRYRRGMMVAGFTNSRKPCFRLVKHTIYINVWDTHGLVALLEGRMLTDMVVEHG